MEVRLWERVECVEAMVEAGLWERVEFGGHGDGQGVGESGVW